ncbi:MAG: hypothetical protein JW885_10150 [Deltaproteobacteria bacterium]|nr:hypothetical protein [Candidatus Zymogenaceae bacterium]
MTPGDKKRQEKPHDPFEDREKTIERLKREGVRFIDPNRVYITGGASIGADTLIYPDVYIEGEVSIGSGCVIEANVMIRDAMLGDGVTVKMCCYITESTIGDHVAIGPFAHLRPGTELADGVKIGNFVETKKSKIEQGSKVNHLSYIGDSEIGRDVNVGAGTITCNYDGVNKHKTVIGDRVFIGSDTQLVAPVTIGNDVLIGAGSTITRNVEPNALAVSRSRQTNYPERGVRSRKGKKDT